MQRTRDTYARLYLFEGLSIARILVLCYVMLCCVMLLYLVCVMAKTRNRKCKIENSADIQEIRREATVEWAAVRASEIGALLICLSLSYSLVI